MTLIELLIVIVILSILAALLFPVFASSRKQGHRAACISNLHQIGLANHMYFEDYNSRAPRMQNLADMMGPQDKKILVCPDDTTGNRGGLIYEAVRPAEKPLVAPETAKYSYEYAFPMNKELWDFAYHQEGESLGILVCQIHGDKLSQDTIPPQPPDITNYEGFLLRLQVDGAVVHRQLTWKRIAPTASNPASGITGDEALLFSDHQIKFP